MRLKTCGSLKWLWRVVTESGEADVGVGRAAQEDAEALLER